MQQRISCLACGRAIGVTPEDAGQTVFCRACGTKVLVSHAVAGPKADQPKYPVPKPRQTVTAEEVPPPKAGSPASSPLAPERSVPSSHPFFRPTNFIAFVIGAAIVLALVGGIWLGRLLHRSTGSAVPAPLAHREADPLRPPVIDPGATPQLELLQAHFRPALLVKQEADAHAAAGRLEAARASYRAFLLVAAEFRDLPDAQVTTAQASADLAQVEALLQARQSVGPTSEPGAPAVAPPAPPANPPAATAPSATTAPAIAAAPATSPTHSPADAIVREWSRGIPTLHLKPIDTQEDDLDAKIDQSILKGVNYLLSQFQLGPSALEGDKLNVRIGVLNNSLDKVRTSNMIYGPYALTVYALASAGQATNNRHLKPQGELLPPMLRTLRAINLANHWNETYIRGVRAAVLALCNRAEDRQFLTQDVNLLVQAGRKNGSHDYTLTGPVQVAIPQLSGRGEASRAAMRARLIAAGGDNSNSQYGTLGVWSGAEAGIEVPSAYWSAVEGFWQRRQGPDGGWSYRDPNGSTLSMTAAGVATLYITYDYLHGPDAVRNLAADPMPKALRAGITWLEEGDRAVSTAHSHRPDFRGYELFALERVGLATGFKYIGTHDWYRELAKRVIAAQEPGGSWGQGEEKRSSDSVVATAFNVLFLSRGRHPILMNKLQFSGNWCNRPRDVANAAKFVTNNLEQPLNWQVVNANVEGGDLLDSPVLYIASDQPPTLSDREIAAIRDYIQGGGTVLLQPDGAKDAFKKWAVDFCKAVCPSYELADLPPNHDLLNLPHRIDPQKIQLKAASNGVRPLVILAQQDIGAAWQVRSEKTQKEAYQLATNLYVYTTGKDVPRRRLQSPAITKPEGTVAGTLRVNRVSYAGNWNPEPGAWPRFGRLFYRETSAAIDIAEIPADQLVPGNSVMAHLTGTHAQEFTLAQISALHNYVAGGGVLLIDAAGGYNAFAESVRDKLFPQAFPDMKLSYADTGEVPLSGGRSPVSDGLKKLNLEIYASEKRGAKSERIQIGRCGKGWVIFSPMDITHGLLGMHTWGVMGYTPETCKAIVKNILVWAGTLRESSPMPK